MALRWWKESRRVKIRKSSSLDIAPGRLLDPNISACSQAELEARFVGLISEIQIRYTDYGIFFGAPSKAAITQFQSLPISDQTEVLSQLRMVYQIALDPVLSPKSLDANADSDKSVKTPNFGLEEELLSLKSFLWRAGFRVSDEDFFTKVRDGDIVEVYNVDHRQIYRSWSFFKFTSYSLADILVYDWNTLYARPAWVISRSFTDVCDLLSGSKNLIKMNVPEFLLAENFSPARHACLVKLRFAAAILDQRSGGVRGYVCNQKGTLVSSTDSKDKISFI